MVARPSGPEVNEDDSYAVESVVEHRSHEADFAPFVGTAADWANYLGRMAKSREWGDELTLQAACGAFAVDVHVISTETEHFHLEYACPVPSAATPRKLFLSYISPIHYNVVVPNK